MIDTTAAGIAKLIVHRVGNKLREEGIGISKSEQHVSEDLELALLSFFFRPFRTLELFRFSHPADMNLNEVFSFASRIFSSPAKFDKEAEKIAGHLYDVSDHPRIKAGDVYIALIKGIKFENAISDAIGIFKSESIDRFLRVLHKSGHSAIDLLQGASLESLDKAALIINLNKDDGYRVLSFSADNEEAVYWHDHFLKLTNVATDGLHTKGYLDLCRTFANELLPETDAASRALFLNESYGYFNSNDTFEIDAFEKLFAGKEQLKGFRSLVKKYENSSGVKLPSRFEISTGVVKKQRSKFRKSIHLDSNIEVKLDFESSAEMESFVERGYDPSRQMNYYKFYFNTEE